MFTSSASRISGFFLLLKDFGSKLDLSLCRDSDSVSASSWNYIKQSNKPSINDIIQKRISCLTKRLYLSLYLLVVVDVLQVNFLRYAEVEEGLPLQMHSVTDILAENDSYILNPAF